MDHLNCSFFVSSKPIHLDIDGMRSFRVGAYMLGSFSNRYSVADSSSDDLSIALDSLTAATTYSEAPNTVSVRAGMLTLTGSDMNTQSLYYILDANGRHIAVFNDLFLARSLLAALGRPVEYKPDKYAADLSFYEAVTRLRAGQRIRVKKGSAALSIEECDHPNILDGRVQYDRDLETSISGMFEYLKSAVQRCLQHLDRAAIALSGGIDSATIAFLTCDHGVKLNAYTVCTEWASEYAEAKKAADYLAIPLQEVHVSTDEVLAEIPNVIRYYYFLEPESIEIALVASCLYKNISIDPTAPRCFVTGYGSDLLNAGVYQPFNCYNELQVQITALLRQTQFSNEFSNFGSLHRGISVVHPFWDSDVIRRALHVPAMFKVVNGQDKYFLRLMMLNHLPKQTVWRSKLAAHHGTGLSEHLSTAFGGDAEYRRKIASIHKDIFYHSQFG